MAPSRRHFLKTTLLGGMAATSRAVVAGEQEGSVTIESRPEIKPSELDEITIVDLQEGMNSGKFTARVLAEKYLARIDAIDKQGPALNSVIEINPEALGIADALDKERKEKG